MNKKKRWLWVALLFILVAFTGCMGSDDQYAPDKAAIETLVNDYFTAAFNIDYTTWTGENELPYLTPDQAKIMEGRFADFKQSFIDNRLTQELDSVEIIRVNIETETSGNVYCIIKVSGHDNGSAYRETIEYSMPVKKIGGQWLIDDFKIQSIE